MKVSHGCVAADSGVGISSTLNQLREALEGLSNRALAAEDFGQFEREVHAMFVAAEREFLAEELAGLDVDLPYVVIDGVRHQRVLRGSETYQSGVGPLTVVRTLYRAGFARAEVPLELRAGIVEGRWTPLAARQAALVVSYLTPQDAETVLREVSNMTPSKSSLDRLPKQLSAHWEEKREAFETELRAGFVVPAEAVTVAVSLDGVMVPMLDGGRIAKRARTLADGKETRGPAGYQEVGCGTVSFYDAAGEHLTCLRFARMPGSKKATLKTMLTAEVEAVLAQRPGLQVVKIADGAKDNWTYLEGLVPEGRQVVDFFHVAEHVKDALDAAYGEGTPEARTQFEKLRHILRHEEDGVEKVIRALVYQRKKHPKRQRIAQVVAYLRRHRHRMAYAEIKAACLPIGSGVVEAACKTLATQRLKCSGMRWRHSGGQAILTLRALVQSDRFDRGWKLLSTTYRKEITVPENVTPFPRKRCA